MPIDFVSKASTGSGENIKDNPSDADFEDMHCLVVHA
jgi:hypothetical protein